MVEGIDVTIDDLKPSICATLLVSSLYGSLGLDFIERESESVLSSERSHLLGSLERPGSGGRLVALATIGDDIEGSPLRGT